MANLLDVVDNVRRNLDDLNSGFFDTNADIIPSIQDGYRLVVSLCETIETHADINFQSGLVVYDMPTYIPDYLRIFGVYNNNTNRWMFPTTMMELYAIRDNWEGASGDPYLFLPLDYRHVAFFPNLTTATGSMTVVYKAKADVLTANSVPQVPEENVNALEFFSTADMLTQCEEFVKALDYAQMADKSIDQIRKVMRERSSPNQIYYQRGGTY